MDESTMANQFLTFTLANEIFAIEITKVKEVLDYTEVTNVPQMPSFMRGVINLRGRSVPVMDLRCKLGMNITERTVNTCIIIVDVTIDEDSVTLGAIADSVKEVIEISPENIEPAPRIGTNLNTSFIKGMGKKDEQFVIILDIDKVFSDNEIMEISSAS